MCSDLTKQTLKRSQLRKKSSKPHPPLSPIHTQYIAYWPQFILHHVEDEHSHVQKFRTKTIKIIWNISEKFKLLCPNFQT